MMAAGRASERGKRVLLIEKNTTLGAKLSISGGGRCNITNAEDDVRVLLKYYGKAKDALYSPFSQFGVKDTFSFFEKRGLPLTVQEKKRTFPKSEKATDVTRVLSGYLRNTGVEVLLGKPVSRIREQEGVIESVRVGGEEYTATNFIVATGGLSHPETGSTGDGFTFLKQWGLPVEKPTPALVPLKTKERFVAELAGITAHDVKILFLVKGHKKLMRVGSVLFTHTGVSGPTIINSAGRVADLLHEGEVALVLDLFPKLDVGALDQKMVALFEEHKNMALKNVFRLIAPPGMAEVLLARVSSIESEKKVHSITKEERRKLVEILKGFSLTVAGLMGYDKAVVADGGLPLTEVDTKTMRVKKMSNLFVTGDLLHISRPSGGYSLQLCWTTGYVAGSNV